MAHAPIDGPLGLEGRHQFKAGDSTSSLMMYGKRQPLTSYVKIDKIAGIHALGDADDFREPSLGRTGEVVYPSAQRGKTLVYEGRVIATTLPLLRQQAAILRRVAAETRERYEGSMVITDPAVGGEGYATAIRCIQLEMDDEQYLGPTRLPSPYQRKFTLGVRMHDPRWEWLPVEELLNNAFGATVTLNNEGGAHADLIFDVVSATAITGYILLENLTTERSLRFDAVPIDRGAGDLLRVVWSQRAAVRPNTITDPPTYNPNTDMMPYLDLTTSDWWDSMEWGLVPGPNEIKVSVGGGTGSWDVWWSHTSY